MKVRNTISMVAVIILMFSMSLNAYAGYWQDQYAVYESQGNTTGMAMAHAAAVANNTSNCPNVAVTYTGTIPSTPSWATTDNNVATEYSSAVTLLQSRGYATTATNIAAAEQELKNYATSNSITGSGSTVTSGTMVEAGVSYKFVSGVWIVQGKYDDAITGVSQSYLNQIAALRLAWQNAEAAGDTTTMAALNNSANTLRSSTYGYTSGSDGAYLLESSSSTVTTTSNNISYYIITSSSEGRGSISPSGSTSVPYLGSQAYTITPLSGYKISDVKVDGVSVGARSTYSFYDVTASHTIVAYFVANITLSVGNLSLTGLTDDGTIKSGYGFGVSVPITTNGVVKSIVATITNGSTVTKYNMETTDGTNYHLPLNAKSVTGARVYYVPVNTADDTKVYVSVTVTVGNSDTSSSNVTYTASAGSSAVTVATEKTASTKVYTCYPSMSVDSAGNVILSGLPVVVTSANISSYQGYYWKDDSTGQVYKVGICTPSTTTAPYPYSFGTSAIIFSADEGNINGYTPKLTMYSEVDLSSGTPVASGTAQSVSILTFTPNLYYAYGGSVYYVTCIRHQTQSDNSYGYTVYGQLVSVTATKLAVSGGYVFISKTVTCSVASGGDNGVTTYSTLRIVNGALLLSSNGSGSYVYDSSGNIYLATAYHSQFVIASQKYHSWCDGELVTNASVTSYTWQFYPVTVDYISSTQGSDSLTKSTPTSYVLVEGNMYEDDFSGDN